MTLGENIEDTFSITYNDAKLTDETFREALRSALCQRLDEHVANT